MKNEKGQALVEFIIILPITILLVFCIVDFGRVISLKADLENVTSDVVSLYENGNTPDEIKLLINENKKDTIELQFITNENYLTITASKKIKPITPGLSYIPGDIFNVSISRVIKMSKLSNKGQSLAIFVIFIPFFILMGTFVVDMGYAKYNANKLDNLTKMIIKYGIKHIDEDPYNDMVDLIYQNDDEIDNYSIKIDPENKKIDVSIDKATKGFFGSIIGKEIYIEKSFYTGYIKEDRIIIEEGAK